MTHYAELSYPPELVWRQVGYQTYDKAVDAFHASTARYRFASAPNQSSKSYASAHDILGKDIFPPFEVPVKSAEELVPIGPPRPLRESQLIWIVGPAYMLCREFDYLYHHLVDNRRKYGWDYKIQSGTINNPRNGALRINIRWPELTPDGKIATTTVRGMSATHEQSLQSDWVDVALISEAANQPERIWDQYLVPRCSKIIVPTTPKIQADWIRDKIEQGGAETEVFVFPPWSNPNYDWEGFRISAEKAESLIAKPNRYRWGYRGNKNRPRDMTPGTSCAEEEPMFAETRLGSWTYASERVIPFKWLPDAFGTCHVEKEVPEFLKLGRARYYVALDYGWDDPSCVGFWAVSSAGRKILAAEIYERHLTPGDIVDLVQTKLSDLDWHNVTFIGDPKKPEANELFVRRGMNLMVLNKRMQADRMAGHMELVDQLAVNPDLGKPMLSVLSDKCGKPYGCPKTIREWKLLRRKKLDTGEFSPTSFEGADHSYDQTRYALLAFPRGPKQRTYDPGRMTFDALKARYRRNQRRMGKIGREGALIRA